MANGYWTSRQGLAGNLGYQAYFTPSVYVLGYGPSLYASHPGKTGAMMPATVTGVPQMWDKEQKNF